MKKVLALVLVLLLTSCLFACSNNEEIVDEKDDTKTQDEIKQDEIKQEKTYEQLVDYLEEDFAIVKEKYGEATWVGSIDGGGDVLHYEFDNYMISFASEFENEEVVDTIVVMLKEESPEIKINEVVNSKMNLDVVNDRLKEYKVFKKDIPQDDNYGTSAQTYFQIDLDQYLIQYHW